LVGSKDRSTGTIHVPPQRVSRVGGAMDDMEPAPMADEDGTVATFLSSYDDTTKDPNMVADPDQCGFLTAGHGVWDCTVFFWDMGIPSGYFMEDDRVLAGLNGQLGKVFGRGGSKFALAYSNQQAYLDRDLITSKLRLSLENVEKEAASYLMTLDGVADVVTASELDSADFTTGARQLVGNGYNRKRSGDVIVIMEPSWIEYKERFGKKGTTHGAPYDYDTHVPLIFYGRNIKKGESMRPVFITDITPTVSALLKIPYPNGATGNPLSELFNRQD